MPPTCSSGWLLRPEEVVYCDPLFVPGDLTPVEEEAIPTEDDVVMDRLAGLPGRTQLTLALVGLVKW